MNKEYEHKQEIAKSRSELAGELPFYMEFLFKKIKFHFKITFRNNKSNERVEKRERREIEQIETKKQRCLLGHSMA